MRSGAERLKVVDANPQATEPKVAISVSGLGKSYSTASGEVVKALEDVTLDIGEGEFLSVVGPSGCGKSTLLKIAAGLIPQSVGTLEVAGSNVGGPRSDVGVVFQSPLLLPWRTVRENALLPLELQGRDTRGYQQKVDQLLELVGLREFGDKYPFELSGGMQQRASITRALIDDPGILLMDEPFGALDAMMRELMNVELQRIWLSKQKTIFFITHSIPEAVFLSDRVVVLTSRPGRIAEIVDVDIPRPRDINVMGSDQFGAYTRRIRSHFDLQGGVDI